MGSCQREFEEIVLRAYAPMYGFRGPTAVEDFRRYLREQIEQEAAELARYLDGACRQPLPAGPAQHSEPAKWNPAWDAEIPPTYKAQAYFISTEASPRPPWTDANPTRYGCRRE